MYELALEGRLGLNGMCFGLECRSVANAVKEQKSRGAGESQVR